jgi:ectoine hydroxylase-related dioxygenase (phytanoyl-CoA dioxygenase family)
MTINVDAQKLCGIKDCFDRDGAAVIRSVISQEWLTRLAEGTERIMTGTGTHGDLNRPGEGRFFGDLFAYLRTPEYKNFIFESGIAKLVADIMGSNTVRFFYDQPLVKEPGTPKRTPWHIDSAYWPCRGWQVMSVWVPLDPATPENGVVTYVKGSHKWGAYYPMENWSENVEAHGKAESLGDAGVDEIPGPGATVKQPRTLSDIRNHPENYEFATWDVQPGDVIIHHMNTIHGAPGNLSRALRRRAIAFRFFGDDARWDDSRPHFMRRLNTNMPDFPYPDHKTGDLITHKMFPILFSRSSA